MSTGVPPNRYLVNYNVCYFVTYVEIFAWLPIVERLQQLDICGSNNLL